MENNWEPRIGQKVVALRDGQYSNVKKGDVFTVKGVLKCCAWSIDIGHIIPPDKTHVYCHKCHKTLSYTDGIRWFAAEYFAPIEEKYSKSLSQELAQQALKETIEIDVPLKVLEN